jgi:4-amino-4-deoxy-L-arabinose transferase-like glycosyltransferase
MGFYYDQGRDALVMWRLWNEGKFFLIGPITGLSGIFLGPFYYYLIAPFYFIGGGDPAYPAVFLAFLSVVALSVLYYMGKEMHSRTSGLIAVTIASFSYYLILAGRWLSNPTPILLTSILLLLSLWKISIKEKQDAKYWWIVVSLLVGISMHFESASAIFYIPIVLVFTLWQWKKIPPVREIILSFFAFFLTLLPQLLFNFRHDNLLINNFVKLFIEQN